MRRTCRSVILIRAVALAVCGCTSDDYLRVDGVTTGAGDAIAANTVMQMVDPWQHGVQDTRLARAGRRAATAPRSGGCRPPASQALTTP